MSGMLLVDSTGQPGMSSSPRDALALKAPSRDDDAPHLARPTLVLEVHASCHHIACRISSVLCFKEDKTASTSAFEITAGYVPA